MAKCCFLVIIKYYNWDLNKIWKLLRKAKMAAACAVIYVTMVAMETNQIPHGYA